MSTCFDFRYSVSISSEFGTNKIAMYEEYLNEVVGYPGDKWEVDDYRWSYNFWFVNETDATMFALKWK